MTNLYSINENINENVNENYDNDNDSDNQHYNELHSSSSISSQLTSITLDSDEFLVIKIKHNRNRPRINNGQYIGSLAFDVIWQDNTETREPLQNLINKDTKNINEHIIDIIDDYKQTARLYPYNNRCCLMCNNYVYNGNFLCGEHFKDYSFIRNL